MSKAQPIFKTIFLTILKENIIFTPHDFYQMFGPHKQSSSVFRYSASKAVKMMVGEKDVKMPLTSEVEENTFIFLCLLLIIT